MVELSTQPPGVSVHQSGAQTRLSPLVVIFLVGVCVPLLFSLGGVVFNIIRLLTLIMFVPLFVGLYTGRYGGVKLPDWAMLFYTFWVAITLFKAHGASSVQLSASNTLEFMGSYMLARAYIRNLAQFVAMAKILGILVCLTLPLAVYEAMTGHPILLNYFNSLPFFYGLPPNYAEVRLGLERVQLTFDTAIHYGIFCALAIALTHMVWGGGLSVFGRYARTTIVSICCFLSLSSAPLIGMAMQFGLMSWDHIFKSIRQRWQLFGLMCLGLYVAVALSSSRPVINVFMTYMTFNATNAWWRLAAFEWGMKTIWKYPIFGIGMNDWERAEWMFSPSVDNYWLATTMRNGIPAFLALVIVFGYTLYRVIRTDFNASEPHSIAKRAWCFAMGGLIFSLATVYMWGSTHALIYFFVGAGVWMTEPLAVGTGQPTDKNTQAEASDLRGGGPFVYSRKAHGTSRHPAVPSNRPATAANRPISAPNPRPSSTVPREATRRTGARLPYTRPVRPPGRPEGE
ncbi:MAG: O-antigen ligase family protein [Pseudomonadota bacterium]